MDPFALLAAGAAGSALTALVFAWKTKPTPSQTDLMDQNIALTILAGEAMSRLDEEDREELEDAVNDKMKQAFAGEAGIVLEEVPADE